MKQGFTILEVMIALALVIIIIVSFVPLAGWYNNRAKRFQYDSQAALVLLETMEATYSVVQGEWPASFTNGDKFFPGEDLTGGAHWELFPGQENNYQTRFTRWVEFWQVCRKADTGESKDYPCDATYPLDTKSFKAKGFVRWREVTGNKTISAELLVVDIN